MSGLQCSFCGKAQDQVGKLIAGPGVYICDECVDLCQEILDEERAGQEPDTSTSEPTPEEMAYGTPSSRRRETRSSAPLGRPGRSRKPVAEEAPELSSSSPDERAESPYERVAKILTQDELREALESLSYRERRVLELRYGLAGEHPRTLDAVGRTFNVTRERIRQVEAQALKKLQAVRGNDRG